jgi:hypothetical protein
LVFFCKGSNSSSKGPTNSSFIFSSTKLILSKASTNSLIPLSETIRPTKIKTKSVFFIPKLAFRTAFSSIENNSGSK